MNLTELASKTKLFAGIDAKEIDELLYKLNGVKKTYRKHEIVIHAGWDISRLILVVSVDLHV